MGNIDLQAAVTSMVAQALEEFAAADGIGYWVSIDYDIEDRDRPGFKVFAAWNGQRVSNGIRWPLDDKAVSFTVRRILGRMGILKDGVEDPTAVGQFFDTRSGRSPLDDWLKD